MSSAFYFVVFKVIKLKVILNLNKKNIKNPHKISEFEVFF